MVEEQSAGGQDISEFKAKIEKEIMENTKFDSDFKPGVKFMDLFSITSNPVFFRKVLDAFKFVIEHEIGRPGDHFNVVVGLDARGFILGPILALEWNLHSLDFFPKILGFS